MDLSDTKKVTKVEYVGPYQIQSTSNCYVNYTIHFDGNSKRIIGKRHLSKKLLPGESKIAFIKLKDV